MTCQEGPLSKLVLLIISTKNSQILNILCEVLIFFLDDNDLEKLMDAIPKISRYMIDVFHRLE